ncbi:hypothetical protein [Bradyrhizobium liaoningense]|uniref:hypothetical protein n=1 Tax=Bradyrhizobium liaoningense TaxID=43992 RepID=UPI001BA73A5C|nr:hypothetical protein [Bradyrhizobium liaoningense]MBR0716564.1 hypothetical protein [Bradyrhizobium liaoningense]
MKAHLAQLRDQAAECATLSAEAETKEKREFFATLSRELTTIADRAEGIVKRAKRPGGDRH